jgi:predicted outer membrane protein
MIRCAVPIVCSTLLLACAARSQSLQTIASSTQSAEDHEVQVIEAIAKEPLLANDKLFVLREYRPALREQALAQIVIDSAVPSDIRSLAQMVRDGHGVGIAQLRSIAADLKLELPAMISTTEAAELAVLRTLPPAELATFFLLRQRAMHAWDITVFTDHERVVQNDRLRRYISETIKPLREHAETVDRVANAHGIRGGLVTVGQQSLGKQ